MGKITNKKTKAKDNAASCAPVSNKSAAATLLKKPKVPGENSAVVAEVSATSVGNSVSPTENRSTALQYDNAPGENSSALLENSAAPTEKSIVYQSSLSHIENSSVSTGKKPTIFRYIADPGESSATSFGNNASTSSTELGNRAHTKQKGCVTRRSKKKESAKKKRQQPKKKDDSDDEEEDEEEDPSTSSAVAMMFDGGVLVATNVILTLRMKKSDKDEHSRIYQLHDNIICAALGRPDLMEITMHITRCRLEMEAFNSGFQPVWAATAHEMLQQMVFKADGILGSFVVIGLNPNGLYLSTLHFCGASTMLPYTTVGSHELDLMPVLENEWRQDISEKEAIDLAFKTYRYSLRPMDPCRVRINICIFHQDGTVRNMTKMLRLRAAEQLPSVVDFSILELEYEEMCRKRKVKHAADLPRKKRRR